MNKYLIILPIITFIILLGLAAMFGKSQGMDKLE